MTHDFKPGDSQDQRLRSLWASVVHLALQDCLGNSYGWAKGGGYDKEAARNFCLSEHGEWRRAREIVCALAGVEADSLREKALKLLADGDS